MQTTTAPTAPTARAAETAQNRRRFAALSAEELMQKAQEWDGWRRARAAFQFAGYRLDTADGALLNLASGETYQCEDARRWDALPGTVVFLGCDCDDEQKRLRPLREAMDARGCGAPCYCKHYYVRLLLAGHTIQVNGGYRVRAKWAAK